MRFGAEVGGVLTRAVIVVAVVLVVGTAGAGAACKLALDCGRGEVEGAFGEPVEGGADLEDGFREEVVADGLDVPTSFDVLPDGRMLVAERAGRVRLVDDGVVAAEPVLDLSEGSSVVGYRGLVALTVDPRFADNGFVYLLYSPPAPSRAEVDGPGTARLLRFRMTGEKIEAASGAILLGSAVTSTGSCTDLPATADCLPADRAHMGGDIAFAPDGTLFVSTGDGGDAENVVRPTTLRAQDPDALGGKVLRITRDGKGLAANPFFDGDVEANRAKVWAVGLRNPFRLALAPGSSLPVVADVGWTDFEELDLARRGVNLGWPCFEGPSRTRLYSETALCRALYVSSDVPTPPLIALPHASSPSITGGVFVPQAAYPEPLGGSYVFGDWALGLIRVASIDPASGTVEADPVEFGSHAGGPVQFRLDGDGRLYYLSLNNGEILRIVAG